MVLRLSASFLVFPHVLIKSSRSKAINHPQLINTVTLWFGVGSPRPRIEGLIPGGPALHGWILSGIWLE